MATTRTLTPDVDRPPVEGELTFRQMVDGISALVAVLTPDGAVDFVNRQVLDYFGKTLEDLRAWASIDAVHPDDLPGAIAVSRRSLESGQPYDIELRQRRMDGVYRWFHVQGLPVRGAAGRILRWCILQTDIDERKRAEEALRESARELRQLVDSVPGMIAVANARGESEYVNKRAIDYLDTTAHEFGERPMSTVHPDDQEQLRSVWRRCNELGQPLDLVHRVRRFDGVYRWVHVRGEPLLDDRGGIARWYYLFTDIDDQRRAEEALRETERELRELIDSVPGMIVVADAAGRQEYGNKGFADYTGATVDELKGFNGLKRIHPDEQESVTNEWLRVHALGQPLEVDHRLRRADGTYGWVHVRTDPHLDDRGRIVRWYGLLTDIDDQKKAEESLRQSEEHLRLLRRKLSAATQVATVAELSASIAHEVNQPLASVVTNAHACQAWLAHDPPNLERARVTLERIIRDGHSAADVVRRIRALFKQTTPVKAALDIKQTVAEVLRLLSDELRDNGVLVETELAMDLPRIEADHVQLQQLLINVVHNAMEAMDGVTERAKSLVVSTRREGADLLIQVRDHGSGIKDPRRVFEPFFTTKASGMGMGLAICRSIVEAHGGQIWATENEDMGMTFSINLPMGPDESSIVENSDIEAG